MLMTKANKKDNKKIEHSPLKSEYDEEEFDKDDYSSPNQYKQQKEDTPKKENKAFQKKNDEEDYDHDSSNLKPNLVVQKVNKSIDAHK